MFNPSRRAFLQRGSLGLAAAGAAGLVLRADARATEPSGDDQEANQVAGIRADAKSGADAAEVTPPKVFKATEDNILGPYYRAGAPYRAKVTPPLEPGEVLVISGRVWGLDTRKPLAGAVLDIWQANDKGRYDNDDPTKPPAKGVFVNRARVVTDETGYYEVETILPGRYQIGADTWRPRHIHYLVRHDGYKRLVTQLYFQGDPYNKTDEFIRESLIIDLAEEKIAAGKYKSGRFDIVLAKA
jgi:catechol 1,2-dioxygenase